MKHLIFVIVLFFNYNFIIAQDANFSQYSSTRTYTNPAFAGTDSTLVLSAGYRIEWPNIDNGYRTFHFSSDQYVPFLKGGVGISYLNDNSYNNTFSSNSIDLTYAPHFELFKHKLAVQPALSLGFFQKKN